MDDVKNISSYTDVNMLLAVQILLASSDSKDFVDRPTKFPLEVVLSEFHKIQKDLGLKMITDEILGIEHAATETRVSQLLQEFHVANKKNEAIEKKLSKIDILNRFVNKNFYPTGYDITEHKPEDYVDHPRFLNNLKNKKLIEVAKKLNSVWNELSRKKIDIDGGSSTLLNLPHPFIIPGGRFREFYYWDTYWILEGLLVCDMYKTAENIIRNFINIIQMYGYIPNGTRKYYLYRSEPPFFTIMLFKMLDYEGGIFNNLILNEGLKAAIKEYEFWENYRKIEVEDKFGEKHWLNHYHVHSNFPRPESFSEDIITFERQHGKSEEEVFSNIKSGAESGWDFSSRWLEKETELKTIEAYHQIPVDLNAILYRNEQILYTLLSRKGDKEGAIYFLKKSQDRKRAINAVLWNEIIGSWMDYVVSTKKFVDYRFYFSNITPMIYGIEAPNVQKNEYDILKLYAKELFGFPGGIPASGEGVETKQQWDFPNVWAPHQHMMVEYLLNIKEEELAFHIAKGFFNSIYEGFKNDGAFYEKYHCQELGFTGGGGEYAPQTGFGWTNGTALSFILKYGDKIMDDYNFTENYNQILSLLENRVRNPNRKKNYDENMPPLNVAKDITIDLVAVKAG